MFNQKLKLAYVGILLMIGVGCTRSPDVVGDPKARLKEYIARSFSVKSVEDKEQLLTYLTGDVRRRLEGWSADQFRDAFISTKRNPIKTAIRELKVISEDEVEITYELIYNEVKKDASGQSVEAKITDKKLCQMVRGEHGRWYIADVKNIKELIELKDVLSF